MLQNLMFFSVFSLVVLMIFPAYAAVESLSFEKAFYTNEESFIFVGIESVGKKSVAVVIRGPGGDFIDILSAPVSDSDGQFSTFPRPVENVFKIKGTYNATAFTDDQNEKSGITIQLEYDGNKVIERENFVLTLRTVADVTITEGKTLSFSVSVTDSSLDNLIFSLEKNPPSGASINPNTGQFIWTPSASHGNANGILYNFDIVVEKGSQKDSESIIITVKDPVETQPKDEPKEEPKDESKEEPKDESKELGIASFVDQSKDPQSYVDRYNNEPAYKKWFDENFPEYDSIYEAVGLKEVKEIAPFVDPNQDPQYYVDRYNNEPAYKKWFDDKLSRIFLNSQAVGLKEMKGIAPFVDPTQDPQYYVDRYENEPKYKEWFDENFPEYDSIYEAVGLDEQTVVPPKIGECGKGTKLVDGVCTVVDQPKGGGCLIATAAYGSEMAPQVQFLREIRDNKVMSTELGASFMTGFNQFYYSFSPVIADYERENPLFKEAVKLGLTPMLSSLSILSIVDVDSEQEMLGYGIAIIMLNIGMYFVAPAMVLYGIKKAKLVRF